MPLSMFFAGGSRFFTMISEIWMEMSFFFRLGPNSPSTWLNFNDFLNVIDWKGDDVVNDYMGKFVLVVIVDARTSLCTVHNRTVQFW